MGVVRKREGKKGVSWQIDYIDPNGKRVRESFAKKKDAEAELGKRVSLIAERRYLDVKKDYKSTFKELLDKYEENFRHQPSFDNWKKFCIKNFKEYFGEETRLSNMRYMDMETYRNKLKLKITKQGGVRTDAAVNREVGVLRHIFRKAVEWEMIEESPFDRGRSLQLKENNKRIRYLSEYEIGRLLQECQEKVHLRRIVVCALNTGMRRKEILTLKWDQIKNGFIYLRKTKTDESREIPINDDLDKLFKEIRKDQQLANPYVFTYNGLTIQRVDRAFSGALGRAGIKDFKFHDLRHTFASHFVMRGGSLKELQEILGHKTPTMTMRYAHLSQEHKKKAINRLNGLTAPSKKSGMSQNVTNLNSAVSVAL